MTDKNMSKLEDAMLLAIRTIIDNAPSTAKFGGTLDVKIDYYDGDKQMRACIELLELADGTWYVEDYTAFDPEVE